MSIRIDITGTRELERSLRKLERLGRTDVIDAALKDAAEPIVAAAKANARRISTRGANSVESFPVPGERAVAVGVDPGSAGFFLNFFEFGTGPRSTKSGKGTGSLRARPWLRPAADSSHATASAAFAARIREEIAKVTK